jgi:cell division cycle 14
MKKFYILNNLFIDQHYNINNTEELINKNKNIYYFSTDNHECNNKVMYEYGPPNIGNIYNFCNILDINLEKIKNRKIAYYIYNDKKSYNLLNTVFLIGCYFILKKNYKLEDVLLKLIHIFNEHPTYYVDSTNIYGGYTITLIDCFKSINFVYKNNIFNLNNFDYEYYAYSTNLETVDFNIICDNMIITRSPQDNNELLVLKKIFLKNNIKTLIRLNSDNNYHEDLIKDKINIIDLFFNDRTLPELDIIEKFMNIINTTDKIAIHCKAGLGRTGLLACLWLITQRSFSTKDAIAWLRMIRPGCVHGYQGHFIQILECLRNSI